MKVFLGLVTPLVAYLLVTLLHVVLPARRTKGYVRSERTGEVLNYRLNGLLVLCASLLAWFLLGYFDLVPYTWLYEMRWYGLIGAVALGLAFSAVLVFRHPSTGRSVLADFWFGRIKNPQLGDGSVDAKVWLYLVGAVVLQLNVLSFAAYHLQNVRPVNPGFLLGCALLTWFCFDYLIFEKVHLWTYDFLAERVGFKLGFGCLAFYPYFYSVSLWFTADRPDPGRPAWLTGLFAVLFLGGWVLTRGANLQKYRFRTQPGARFLWIRPEALTDGERSLLANGFWGRSRHINYLGEIVQAVAIALAPGLFGVWAVWLYPAYYVGLMLPRQADDDRICREKYGPLWDRYCEKAKDRIIPYVY